MLRETRREKSQLPGAKHPATRNSQPVPNPLRADFVPDPPHVLPHNSSLVPVRHFPLPVDLNHGRRQLGLNVWIADRKHPQEAQVPRGLFRAVHFEEEARGLFEVNGGEEEHPAGNELDREGDPGVTEREKSEMGGMERKRRAKGFTSSSSRERG